MPSELTGSAVHWEQVYGTKRDQETSWFQEDPSPSFELVSAVTPPGGRVLDAGGGSSLLGSRLARHGFEVTVIDCSATALERGRLRGGEPIPGAPAVTRVTGDLLHCPLPREVDTWHDRAVFHFLREAGDQARYVDRVRAALRKGGHVVIGTFGMDGPTTCSGLEVCRYDRVTLATVFGAAFEPMNDRTVDHRTPWGRLQAFQFVVLRRSD